MDTKRNQTLEEIEENKIVNEHYQNRVMLIKKLLKTSRLATVDLCVHIDISEASYYRYINFTSYMKADIFIHACLFLKHTSTRSTAATCRAHAQRPRRSRAIMTFRPWSRRA